MGWATHYIQQLQSGIPVEFRPRGKSMTGKIEDGNLVRVVPIESDSDITEGTIVLCKVNGNYYLHLIGAKKDDRFMIQNNHGFQNGWTKQIYGRVISVED